ncbi:uncharacterized protein LOC129585282 isoform X2 [Paramacrobiotus metropolitanus]|uniref:uncharacterized protein LOC129585282 isoform X2 n=1 Tax=Paramacrobiotus metropolitanus TaxID=2943436 RepID=UPI0024462926|nr:uncharacterized protein LOC129585282 isoform X2 [Paramacrobiotus metropolitanus]
MASTNSDAGWNLDSFLGAYDMIWDKSSNMINFSEGVVGLPASVIKEGERQIYKKTGERKYEMHVLRKDPKYNIIADFELGKKTVKNLPNNQTLSYTLEMTGATTLKGTYEWDFGDHMAAFGIVNTFKPDGSGFFNDVTVTKPKDLRAHAPFYRIKEENISGPITLGPS